MAAYLAMMAVRLIELHRVLKPTGSIYLHCDPSGSHYLKVLLDSIFGHDDFRNEIIWKRTSGHSDTRRYGRVHDVILYYVKSNSAVWNPIRQDYEQAYVDQYYRYKDPDGRRWMSDNLSASGLSGGGYEYEWKGIRRVWRVPLETMERLDQEGKVFYTKNGIPRIKRYLDQAKGLPAQDMWTDIEALRSWHPERLPFPTQKPVELLERIIQASCNEGDLVLDPFCGCGTTIIAAQKLNRRWVGIDVTWVAIDLVETRLRRTLGESVKDTYSICGHPSDVPSAASLARKNKKEFELWAISLVGATSRERDGGVDGLIGLLEPGKKSQKVVVQVKGGDTLNPGMVRDLIGTVGTEKAAMGLLITLREPTSGMRELATHNELSSYQSPITGRNYAPIQIRTVGELLEGKSFDLPPPHTYFETSRTL